MQLTSPKFKANQPLPKKYTCDGEGINPPLNIIRTPPKTKSLALLVEDPDAPNGIFTHWILWQIRYELAQIEEGAIPTGAKEGQNDFGKIGYGAPCPPTGHGPHRYMFKLYALDTDDLSIPISPNREDFLQAVETHVIEQAKLIGTYERQE
jgi:hypothetical protein